MWYLEGGNEYQHLREPNHQPYDLDDYKEVVRRVDFYASWQPLVKFLSQPLKMVVNIQALELLRYVIYELFMLILLKHRGFLCFPTVSGFNPCDLSIESLSLIFFLCPESLYVANARSGSTL